MSPLEKTTWALLLGVLALATIGLFLLGVFIKTIATLGALFLAAMSGALL